MSNTYIFGFHPVLNLLQHHPKKIEKIYIKNNHDRTRFQPLINLAYEKKIIIEEKPLAHFQEQFPDQVHQGVAAIIQEKQVQESDLEEILNSSATRY